MKFRRKINRWLDRQIYLGKLIAAMLKMIKSGSGKVLITIDPVKWNEKTVNTSKTYKIKWEGE